MATAAIAVPGVLLPGCRGRYEDDLPPGTKLETLAVWEFVVLRAAAARILAGAAPGPAPEEVVRRADAALGALDDPAARAGLRQALMLLEYGTVFRGYVRPFSALATAAQDRVLDGLARSRLQSARVAFGAVKLLSCYYHYTDPSTWPALGYDGAWVGRVPMPVYAVDYGRRNGTPFTSGTRPYPREKA